MLETTPAFEAYLKDFKNKAKIPPKGRDAKAGRLNESVDELSEKNDDDQEEAIA